MNQWNSWLSTEVSERSKQTTCQWDARLDRHLAGRPTRIELVLEGPQPTVLPIHHDRHDGESGRSHTLNVIGVAWRAANVPH